MPDFPKDNKSFYDRTKKDALWQKLKTKPTPKRLLEYTQELLHEISHEKKSEASKKHKLDLTIERMMRLGEIHFERNIHLMALQLKLSLLKRRHLFLDLERRLLEIKKRKRLEEEDIETRKEERAEEEQQRKREKALEEEQQRDLAAKKKHEREQARQAGQGEKTIPEQSASDMADNFLDLTELVCDVLKMQGGMSLFSQEDTDQLKKYMIDLDNSHFSPEAFEQQLFHMIDHIDKMFNKAKVNFSSSEHPLLNACQERVGNDLMQWLQQGSWPKYSQADKLSMQQQLQEIKENPEEYNKNLERFASLRAKAIYDKVRMQGNLAASQPSPSTLPPTQAMQDARTILSSQTPQASQDLDQPLWEDLSTQPPSDLPKSANQDSKAETKTPKKKGSPFDIRGPNPFEK